MLIFPVIKWGTKFVTSVCGSPVQMQTQDRTSETWRGNLMALATLAL